MPDSGTVSGRLTRAELEERIRAREIDTVLTVFPDLYGRLVGKRITGRFFVDEVADHGMHTCDYLLACDMEMEPTPGYAFTSWKTGYGDVHCVPDWSTARRASWLPGSALVLCDVLEERSGKPVEIAPRRVLARQRERARQKGFVAMGASELEFFVFQETYASARDKSYENLRTYGSYVEDYHILQGTKVEPLVGDIRRHLEDSGIPVEFSKGEWGPGQHEINVRYCEFLEMADRHVIYKHLCKEVAIARELSLTFMAKWNAQHAGNSFHLHASLWDPQGRALFGSGDGPALRGSDARPTQLFYHWLAGLLAHARELSIFFAPLVNSYKRYIEGTFAPTVIAWAYDNRTAGFRVVGHGDSLRTECRIPGADANPYMAYAGILAAGLDGIERKLEPPPMLDGNLYENPDVPQVPRTLGAAIEVAQESRWLRDTFGDAVIDHYLHFARTEKRKFDETVTTWERARYFERG